MKPANQCPLRIGVRALLIAVGLLVIWRSPMGWAQTASRPSADTLTIVHTNDLHAHLLQNPDGTGGLASIAAFAKQTRRTRARVLFLDAGDMTQGTPVTTFFLDRPVFEAMNAAGYDAAVLGNHDFDNGLSLLAEYRRIAKFPLLSANLWIKGQLAADAPTAVLDINGLKVGILALSTDPNVDGVRVEVVADAVRRHLPDLDRRSDLVIALTHLGLGPDCDLAREFKQIDVIIGGHSHSLTEKPVMVGDTVIVQAGEYGQAVGVLNLTINRSTGKIIRSSGRLVRIPVPGLAADPQTKEVIGYWEGKIADKVDVKIGYNPTPLTLAQVERCIERIWRDACRTDFAVIPGGGARHGLPAGDILIRYVYNILPFADTLYILDLDRAQVTQVCGKVKFPRDKPLYSLVTNSYLGPIVARRLNLPADRVHATGTCWRDSVIAYIRAHGRLDMPTTQPVDTRN